jgi:hypothetical protein
MVFDEYPPRWGDYGEGVTVGTPDIEVVGGADVGSFVGVDVGLDVVGGGVVGVLDVGVGVGVSVGVGVGDVVVGALGVGVGVGFGFVGIVGTFTLGSPTPGSPGEGLAVGPLVGIGRGSGTRYPPGAITRRATRKAWRPPFS